ncbi:MAG: hypothetical protein ACJKSS_00385 [Patescibacteria group bacterium UBA2103]
MEGVMRDVVCGSAENGEDPISAIRASILSMFVSRRIPVETSGNQIHVAVPVGLESVPIWWNLGLEEGELLLLARVFFDGLHVRMLGVSTLISREKPRAAGWEEGFVPDSSADAIIWELYRPVDILSGAETARQIFRSVEMRLPNISAVLSLHKSMCV